MSDDEDPLIKGMTSRFPLRGVLGCLAIGLVFGLLLFVWIASAFNDAF